MIILEDLIGNLEDGERVEADNIYQCHAPQFVKCPSCFTRPEEEADMRKRVGGRQEVINRKIKHFDCLVKKFKGKGTAAEKIENHSNLFRSCCVATQVAMELGVGELYLLGDEYK
jgi:hypothetical protein